MIPEHMFTSVEAYLADDGQEVHAIRALLEVVRRQDRALDEILAELEDLRQARS
jgi:hypothetical protein